jgi:dolichol kinase/phosphoserine phosphatase
LESEIKNRLVIFDVEGVIIPKIRFLLFDIFSRVGLKPFFKVAFLGLLYQVGLMSLKDTLKKIFKLLKGFSYERFISLFQGVPLMPKVENVFTELKRGGYKITLMSSSIPEVALQKLAERLGADFVSGPEIGVSEGRLTGDVRGDVLEPEGKALALKKILGSTGLSSHYCVVVADDRNNLPLFKLCDLKIGLNPDFLLGYKADYSVRGDLSEILPIINGELKVRGGGSFPKKTILRDAIHISGFSVPLACKYLLDPHTAAILIFLVAMLYSVSEIMRMFGRRLPLISDVTRMAAGKSEFQELVAYPLFYALGIIMSLILFPVPISYVSIVVLTLGDGFASIFGKKFGRRPLPINKNKTFEGSLGGLFLAFVGSLMFVDPYRALAASFIGMLTEILPLPVNDNITIPLASGLTLITLTMI